MISICIPIYNYDTRQLVYDLHKQAMLLNISFEIVLLDDGSSDSIKTLNRELVQLGNVFLHENPHNMGVSTVRNRLAELANKPYLLYIDSDAQVIDSNYLESYLKYCKPNVVCFGGCVYSQEPPAKDYILRWKFGKKREEGVGTYYSCFNLLVAADIVKKFPFFEELNLYGYEDSLFGIILKHNNYQLQHINNPLLHSSSDKAEKYLKKINQSLSNLFIIKVYLDERKIPYSIKLLELYIILKNIYLVKPIAFIFRCIEEQCVKNLESSNPKLIILDIYKLGYLCNLTAK